MGRRALDPIFGPVPSKLRQRAYVARKKEALRSAEMEAENSTKLLKEAMNSLRCVECSNSDTKYQELVQRHNILLEDYNALVTDNKELQDKYHALKMKNAELEAKLANRKVAPPSVEPDKTEKTDVDAIMNKIGKSWTE